MRLKRQAFLDKVQWGEGPSSDNSSISEDEVVHEHSLACENIARSAQRQRGSPSGEQMQRSREAEYGSSAEQAGVGGSSSEQSLALQLQDAPMQAVLADAPDKVEENHAYTSGAQEEGQVGVEGGSFKQRAALRLQNATAETALSGVPNTTAEDRNCVSLDRQGHQQETCGICFNTMQHICVSCPAGYD